MVLSHADAVGAVPLRFTISDLDCTTAAAARHPVYLHVPRTTLLFAVQATVFEAFAPYVPDFAGTQHMMLTLEDRAVPWHCPAGVIFDIAVCRGVALATAPLPLTVRITSSCEDKSCPLTLVPTLEPNSVPAQRLDKAAIRCAQRKEVEQFCRQMLKASLHMSYTTSLAYYKLEPKKTTLFTIHGLRETPASRQEAEAFSEILQDFRRTADDKPSFLALVLHFPHIQANRFCSSLTKAIPYSETETAHDLLAGLAAENIGSLEQLDEPKLTVQGVAVHPATPLAFLFNTFASSDYRLHIVMWGKSRKHTDVC